MRLLAITTVGSTLAMDAGSYVLTREGKARHHLPPSAVEAVLFFHGTHATRQALSKLAEHGAAVTFLDAAGRIESRLIPACGQSADARVGQVAAFLDEGVRLLLSKRFVHAKISNAIQTIRTHDSNHPHPTLKEIMGGMEAIASHVAQARDIPALLGIEGAAGRLYFSAFARMLRPDWIEFDGRHRRPPTDPANALLSYTYAVLARAASFLTEAIGLDPYVGYLHTQSSRRPSLALDLIEPFRATLADRLVLRLLNLGTLGPSQFHQDSPPAILITHEGRLSLLQIFYDWFAACDPCLHPPTSTPCSLLQEDIERFTDLAKRRLLKNFIPHYANPKHAEKTP